MVLLWPLMIARVLGVALCGLYDSDSDSDESVDANMNPKN